MCDDFLSFVQYDSATGASSIVVYEFSTDTHEIIALGTPGSNHFSARMDQYGRLWPVVNVTSTEARAASDRDVNLAIELEEGADKAGFEVNAAIASDSTQFHGCRLAWVETAQPVKMEGGQVLPDTPHGGVEDGIIRVVDLPHRRIRAASGPSEWGVEASVGPGFGAQLDDVESEEW